MKLLKTSTRHTPKISLILLDWSVRESFHLLHYLAKQNVSRDLFEVILVEYYSCVSTAARRYQDQIDSWLLLEMPDACYYHKHLMYNAGIVLSQGEICVICDSDAMVKDSFIESIMESFSREGNIVLHLDQFRNARRDFYPFNYPTFDEVLGNGCLNNVDGKTKGLARKEDTIHIRNYGACMCARREHMIAIGGADEHIDFLGHICGPYDMTFRLVNNGLREVWHEREFLYHTWHPGQAGADNYLGPHDGRQISTTALDALRCGRRIPLEENEALRQLRTGASLPQDQLLNMLVSGERTAKWQDISRTRPRWLQTSAGTCSRYKGFEYERDGLCYTAHPVFQADGNSPSIITAATIGELKRKIDALPYTLPQILAGIIHIYSFLCQVLTYSNRLVPRPSKTGRGDGINKASGVHGILPKLGRFSIESRFVGSLLVELIAVLWLLGRMNNRHIPGRGIIVIVDQPAHLRLLHMLKKLRVLPAHTARLIEDEDGLGRIVDSDGAGNETVVIYSRAFFCFYQKVAANKPADRIIVA